MEKGNSVPLNRDQLCTRYECSRPMLYRWFKKENIEAVIPDIHSIRCFTPNQGEKIIEVLDFSGAVQRYREKKRGAKPYQINQF